MGLKYYILKRGLENLILRAPLNNSGFLLLLTLFSCSLMMNYAVRWLNPYVSAVMVTMIIILIINFRNIYANLIVCALNIAVILPNFPRVANHTNLELAFTVIGGTLVFAAIFLRKKEINYKGITLTIRLSLVAIYITGVNTNN